MNIIIRQETPSDYPVIFDLIEKAFRSEEYSEHREHFIVQELRKSDAFIPELALVAEADYKPAGYILLTKIKIRNEDKTVDSLALAPVAVLPEYQRNGIGSLLIKTAHVKAKELGYKSIILLGHKDYYPRFGYVQANKFGIQSPFHVPDENFMAIELTENALLNVSGVVEYPKEFNV